MGLKQDNWRHLKCGKARMAPLPAVEAGWHCDYAALWKSLMYAQFYTAKYASERK